MAGVKKTTSSPPMRSGSNIGIRRQGLTGSNSGIGTGRTTSKMRGLTAAAVTGPTAEFRSTSPLLISRQHKEEKEKEREKEREIEREAEKDFLIAALRAQLAVFDTRLTRHGSATMATPPKTPANTLPKTGTNNINDTNGSCANYFYDSEPDSDGNSS
ncbi:hypothetical protein HK100_007559, partial [Physocladia obscura]